MDNKKTIEKNSGICSTNLADEIAGTSRKVLFYRSGETGKDEIAAFTGQINFNKIEEIEIRYQKEPFVMGHLDWFQNLKRISIYAESDLKIRHSVFSDSVNPLQVIVYAIQGKQITIENNCSIACPKVDIKVVKAEEIHKEWINEIHQIKENVNVDDGLVPYYCSSIKNGLLMYEKSVIEMNNIAPLLKINDYSIHFIDLRYDEGAYRKKEETLLQRIKRDVQWLPSLEIELDNDKARISRMTQAESNLIYSYINDVTRVINAKYLAHNCPVDFHPTKINNIRENKETIAQQYARTDCLDQENEKAAHISKEEALNRIKAKQYMYCGKSFMRNRSDIKAEEELLQSLYRKNKTYFKDFSRFLDKMTKSCDGDTFLYCQIDAKKKEILVDINGIDCFVRRQNKTSNELSFFITLILLRCSFELAFIDKIDEEYYSEYQAIAAIFGRIVATHQLEEYLGRFDKRKMFGINGFHYNRIGEFEKYPETVCSVLDMLCLSENVDIYRQIIERAPNHLPGAYAMLCRQCSTRDHKLQYNKAYDAMAIRAFKEYHPDCTIKSIQQQFLTVPQSVIKELGFSNNEINKAIRNVSIYEHYEDQTLSEVLIDEHIHSIGFKAFARCENLKKLIIDTNGQLFIEPFAFAESALETIEIHAGSIVRISRFAFNRCTRLQKIIVDDEKETILHIEQSGFSGCSHSTLLIYNKTENTESEIGEEYCERGLEEGVRTQSHPDRMMGISPFESFSNIEFSNRIEYIQGDSKEVEPMCFAYCQNLEVVEIRDDSIKLCENAFYKCTNLREIIFPSLAYLRVKVHPKAFCGCGEIKITYPHQDNEERPPVLDMIECFSREGGEVKKDYVLIEGFFCEYSPLFQWLALYRVEPEKLKQSLKTYFGNETDFDLSPRVYFKQKGQQILKKNETVEAAIFGILQQCRTSVFKPDQTKKSIAAYLEKLCIKCNNYTADHRALYEIMSSIMAGERENTLFARSYEFEELHNRLEKLLKVLSLFNRELLYPYFNYESEKQILYVYADRMLAMVASENAPEILDMINCAVVFAYSSIKLLKMTEHCGKSERVRAAFVDGVAAAVMMDWLKTNGSKDTFQKLNKYHQCGIFPYWPYRLSDEIDYQCYGNDDNANNLLTDVIEMCQINPDNAIEMVYQLCCANDEENIYSFVNEQ